MTEIFVAYRRDDTAATTRRVADNLARLYGRDAVFTDFCAIPAGVDFVDYLEQGVQCCRLVIAMIGVNWLGLHREKNDSRRIDNPLDFLRLELEMALKHGVPILPVLVDSAAMPQRRDLPQSIVGVVDRQPILLRDETFEVDYAALEKRVIELRGEAPASKPTTRTRISSTKTPALNVSIGSRGYFFISYAHDHDDEFTMQLASALRAAEIPLWVDKLDIKTGKPWDVQVETALKNAAGVIFIMSHISRDNDNVLNEIDFALKHTKPLIPVRIDECDPPLRIRRIQYADFVIPFDVAVKKLIDELQAAIRGN
jgi:hypothetical protein